MPKKDRKIRLVNTLFGPVYVQVWDDRNATFFTQTAQDKRTAQIVHQEEFAGRAADVQAEAITINGVEYRLRIALQRTGDDWGLHTSERSFSRALERASVTDYRRQEPSSSAVDKLEKVITPLFVEWLESDEGREARAEGARLDHAERRAGIVIAINENREALRKLEAELAELDAEAEQDR